jgi:CHAT domain-containing protein
MSEPLPDDGSSALLIGDIDFDASPGFTPYSDSPKEDQRIMVALRGNSNSHQRLPVTAEEIRAVGDLHRRLFPGNDATIFAQAAATEQAFRDSVKNHRFVHLATHGFFTPAPATGRASDRLKDRWMILQADLMAGVALAGANRRQEPSFDLGFVSDDGILTAAEVTAMDLRRVELVVLSACETGLGLQIRGEGLISLQRALQLAGARSTLTSLWKVEDNATQTLMIEFYRNLWEKKLGKLEALRQAQLTMLREYDPETGRLRGPGEISPIAPEGLPEARKTAFRDGEPLSPFYWAAFVVSGDWR